MFVLGLTLVFGLIVSDEPPGVVPVTLGVDESLDVVPPTPGSAVCAAADPMPMTSAASDAAAIVAYPCFIWLTPLDVGVATQGFCRRDASTGRDHRRGKTTTLRRAVR
jgi:hypothetical protein